MTLRTKATSTHERSALALALALLASVLALASPAGAIAAHTCQGKAATIIGTNGPDVLLGTGAADVIVGLGSGDVIKGRGGDDIICGGGGRDQIAGGPGNDYLDGGKGRDIVKGNAGEDVVLGGPGGDRVFGGLGDDEVSGGIGVLDRVKGDDGIDVCIDSDATRMVCEIVGDECLGSASQSFDRGISQRMIDLSSKAYVIDSRSTTTGDECWELLAGIESEVVDATDLADAFTDTQVFVAQNRRTQDLVVSFRGSASITDWVNDFQMTRVPWTLSDGSRIDDAVHGGFALAWAAVDTEVLAELRAAATPDTPGARVYFTGHSLGGALATLSSLDLVDDLVNIGYDRNDVVMYTFGAPRSMSRELANIQQTRVPMAHAVVNPTDIVPHTPPAAGGNPFTHVRKVVVTHGDQDAGNVVRFEHGRGQDYRGCARMPIGSLADHDRDEYRRRLNAGEINDLRTWLTVDSGEMRLNWRNRLEGPCDWVALYQRSSRPTDPFSNLAGLLNDGRYFAVTDSNNTIKTIHGKADDYWIGYVNMFGQFVSQSEYIPRTPSVSLRRNENFIGGDTIDFRWSVSDPGDRDLIVLYDRDPRDAGVNGYYRSIVGRVEALARTSSPERTQIRVGSDADKWWVAYVLVDDDGNQRILSVSQGVRG
ncbi:MAG: lipase family protein [Acidimicrobiales bacterium]